MKLLFIAMLLCLPVCMTLSAFAEQPQEATPLLFTLQGPLTEPAAEISGLAWYQGRLLLMPQYPDFTSAKRKLPAALFAVSRENIVARIQGQTSAPLPHEEIAVSGLEACNTLPGYEGFEAIAVQGDKAWLLIEGRHQGRMRGWLLQGTFAAEKGGLVLRLHPASITPLDVPVNLRNVGFETLVLDQDAVYAVFEGNGGNVNPEAKALRFSTKKPLPQRPREVAFPTVEYRITDASALRKQSGRRSCFVLNCFWSGQKMKYTPGPDRIAQRFGQGPTHARSEAVERVLELELGPEGFILADTAPLQLTQGMLPRNWEGLAYLETPQARGVLLATDKYPGTLLGFAAWP